MRALFFGVSVLALTATAAQAQQPVRPASPPPAQAQPARPAAPAPTMSSQQEMAKFLVFFDWDKATLTAEARRIIASAAEEFKKSGSARIVATGHTDTSGSAAYNMRLSIRRADAVKAELVRLGVPAASIVTIGKGQTDPLVPTGDGVREPQNRRVEIEFPKPPKVVAAPPPPPPAVAKAAPPPPPPAPKWELAVGAWYGYNIRETDPGNPTKSSNLVGPEVRVGYHITDNWVVFADGAAFNTLDTSSSDGWGGRGILGIQHEWDLGVVRPFIGPHAGYIFGKGTQDGAVIGPEIGANFDITDKMFLYARAAYDHNFRNEWNQGIVNGGLGAGFRF